MIIKISKIILIILIIGSVGRLNYADNEQSVIQNDKKESTKQDDNMIDIRELVNKQIESAQQKQNNKNLEPIVSTSGTKQNNTLKNSSVKETSTVNDFDLGILFATGVGITMLLLILTRLLRKKEVKIDDDLQFLKRKIEMIRNEEPFLSDDRDLSQLRANLCENTDGSKKQMFNEKSSANNISINQKWNSLNSIDDKLAVTARKLKISKGEVILASRIKALQHDNAYRLM